MVGGVIYATGDGVAVTDADTAIAADIAWEGADDDVVEDDEEGLKKNVCTMDAHNDVIQNQIYDHAEVDEVVSTTGICWDDAVDFDDEEGSGDGDKPNNDPKK